MKKVHISSHLLLLTFLWLCGISNFIIAHGKPFYRFIGLIIALLFTILYILKEKKNKKKGKERIEKSGIQIEHFILLGLIIFEIYFIIIHLL